MKPVKSNLSKNGCSPVASDCVLWSSLLELCCITVCEGDTLSSIIYKLSQELCYHKALLDLTILDLGDLVLTGDGERTPVNVLQAIINRIQIV